MQVRAAVRKAVAVVATTGAVTSTALAGVVLTGGAASAASGTEHFVVAQTSATMNTSPLAAIGPLHAAGTDTALSGTRDRFSFPHGDLLVLHKRSSGHQSFDPVACVGRFDEQGTYRVTSGTGDYAKATGHGTYTVNGIFFGCNPHKPPKVISVVIEASGPLSY